jgi:hypothetical protein
MQSRLKKLHRRDQICGLVLNFCMVFMWHLDWACCSTASLTNIQGRDAGPERCHIGYSNQILTWSPGCDHESHFLGST